MLHRQVGQKLGDVARPEHLVDCREMDCTLVVAEIRSENAPFGAFPPQELTSAAGRSEPRHVHGLRSSFPTPSRWMRWRRTRRDLPFITSVGLREGRDWIDMGAGGAFWWHWLFPIPCIKVLLGPLGGVHGFALTFLFILPSPRKGLSHLDVCGGASDERAYYPIITD